MQIDKFMKSIKGLAENTKRAYEDSLYLLGSYIKGEEPTAPEMQKFLNQYKPSTLYRHKAAFKAYWEYRFPDLRWPFNRRSFMAPREQPLRMVKPEVIKEMWEKAGDADDSMFIRALFNLGCRISEVRQVSKENITENGVLVVVKGGNTKLKLVTREFLDELRKYAERKKGLAFPRSYNYYYLLFKRLGALVGHPEVAPHFTRHAKAVDLLFNKHAELPFVQQFLGHSNINTTALYLKMNDPVLSEQLEKLEGNGNNHISKPFNLADLKLLLETDPSLRESLKDMLSEGSNSDRPSQGKG